MVGTLTYTDSDQTAQQGIIVGATVGSISVVVLLIIVVIVVVLLLYRQRRTKLQRM